MSSHIPPQWPALTRREEFEFLTDLVLSNSTGEHVWLTLQDLHSGTVRFARNQVIQHVNTHTVRFLVTIGFGKKHGTAGTTDLTAGGIRDTVQRAEFLARAVPEDPEFLPPPGRQHYESWPTYDPETVEADISGRLQPARKAIELCQAERVQGAGIVTSSVMTIGVAANTGLFAYEPRTEARFSLTAQKDDASGWTAAIHRSLNKLHVENRSLLAIDNCKRGKGSREMPAGRYTVILQPPAVAGLLQGMIGSMDAKSYDTQTSPFIGQLHHPIIDPRFSLYNCPDHPDMLGGGFTREGLPVNRTTWIEKGCLRQLAYDRYTAGQKGIAPIPTLESPCLEGASQDQCSLERLIEKTERGIFVANFWYIRTVNRMDLTLTGMSRDGTFLIENGKVTGSLRNFRFHDSPIRAFQNIGGYTEPQEATSMECGKMLVPALQIRDFHFSSVSTF
jgi:predicted Zn-dependent protease